ncbi:MAG: Lrp/AsnC family transcriptional regulator [Desulfurococcales archaeon]|nr:Lrp/AsnC family transcriptional regulator [Desulfurococcales archaeon]
MDKKDLRILEILSNNSRTPATWIARELGISDVAVKKRIQRLEREGVIKAYRVELNPSKLGYSAVALVGVNVNSECLLEVAQKLSQRKDTVFVALTSGDHDVMIELWARNGAEMQRKLKEIKEIDGVNNVYPAIILDIVRERGGLPKELLED